MENSKLIFNYLFCKYYSIKYKLAEYNPFDVSVVLHKIEEESNIISQKLENGFNMINELKRELTLKQFELEKAKQLLTTIGDTIPDMLWAKDVKGRYIYVNKAIKDELFYSIDYKDIIGKTDIELTVKCKDIAGHDNHTFGEICGDSDKEVIKDKSKKRFLEEGLINGKKTFLEVHKNVLQKDGLVIGTVGTGRDVTEYYTSLKDCIRDMNSCSLNCVMMTDIDKQLDRYKFVKE